jgi:hypothetical protein
MMATPSPSRCEGALTVNGRLTCDELLIPDGTVTDAMVNQAAAIAATKLEHQHEINFSQAHGTAATAERRVIHTVYGGDASLVSISAGVTVACSGVGATITVDVYLNGTTVLSAPISIDRFTATYTPTYGAFTETAAEADDVLEVVVTASAGAGTLGQGLFVSLIVYEDSDQ